jgi:glyoxylate reductase
VSERPKVHLLVPVLPSVERELRASFELVDDPAGVDGIVAAPGVSVNGPVLDRAGSRLRIVANYGVGVDNVDLAAAAARGVVVTNTPDVLTRATAEFAIALLLALVRRVAEGDRLVRRGDEWRWAPTFLLGRGLAGRRLLVVGRGRIGSEVGRLAEALGMEVCSAGRGDELAPLLAAADAVSLHVPLTEATRHLVGAAELRAMKRDAVLVNTSRGAVVDEAALVAVLESGELAGAALDVFEDEPAVHPGLVGRDDVVLTPHVASATVEAREAMGALVVEALRAVLLEGREPRTAVSPT